MPHTYVGRTEGANNYSAADPTITFSSARSPSPRSLKESNSSSRNC